MHATLRVINAARKATPTSTGHCAIEYAPGPSTGLRMSPRAANIRAQVCDPGDSLRADGSTRRDREPDRSAARFADRLTGVPA